MGNLAHPLLQDAIESSVVYPNGRVTTDHAGYTGRGRHSHVAVYDEKAHTTYTLCGRIVANQRTTWPMVDRHNVSCSRCKRSLVNHGVGIGRMMG